MQRLNRYPNTPPEFDLTPILLDSTSYFPFGILIPPEKENLQNQAKTILKSCIKIIPGTMRWYNMKYKRNCEFCGTEFTTTSYIKKYCDYVCSDRINNLKTTIKRKLREKYSKEYEEKIEQELIEILPLVVKQELDKIKSEGEL